MGATNNDGNKYTKHKRRQRGRALNKRLGTTGSLSMNDREGANRRVHRHEPYQNIDNHNNTNGHLSRDQRW